MHLLTKLKVELPQKQDTKGREVRKVPENHDIQALAKALGTAMDFIKKTATMLVTLLSSFRSIRKKCPKVS